MRLIRGTEVVEVHLEGLVVRDGGAKRKFVSATHARAAFDKAIGDRIAKGFVEMPDAMLDLEARAVFGDELMQQGDPHGELVALGLAMRATDDLEKRDVLRKRWSAHVEAHHEELFGELARFVRKPGRTTPERPAVQVDWYGGFAETIRLAHVAGSELHQTYARLTKLPLARYTTKLVIGEPGGDSYVPLVNAMLASGILPRLTRLHLGETTNKRVHAGDVSALIAAIPELEELDLDVATGTFGPFVSSTLRRFVLHALDPAPILGSLVPSLVELELRACAGAALFVDRLPRSPILLQLRRLTIWRCRFGDSELASIAMHANRYRHLSAIDLRGNTFSARALADAKEDLPNIVT